MKKFLSLVLALVMTMSLVTVSAGAKDFGDSADLSGEAYEEAVNVMSEMGIIDGYSDGDFRPQGTLTRQAAAKIIACMMLGKTTAESLGTQAAPFKDVPAGSSFAGYIAFCVERGLISGYADGTFRPTGTLTGFAFLKMLLGALGYDQSIEGYTGTNWTVNVAGRAYEIGLTAGNDEFVGSRACTREEAALYAVNTLKSTLVEYKDKGSSIIINGVEIAQGASEPTYVTSSIYNQATSINDDKDNASGDYTVEFAERYQTDLRLDAETDDFGRPARNWSWKNREIGTYVDYSQMIAEYTTKVTGDELYSLLTRNTVIKYGVDVVIDGEYEQPTGAPSVWFTKNAINRNNDAGVGGTGNGVLTQVFVDNDDKLVTIAIINTYLAIADDDYNEKRDEASFDVYGISKTSTGNVYFKALTSGEDKKTMDVTSEDFPIAADVAKGDAFLVNVADGEIQIMQEAEIIANTEIDAFETDSNKGSDPTYDVGTPSRVEVDGTEYNFASAAEYDYEVLNYYTNSDTGTTNLKDTTYNVYLDQYGYAIGVEEVESADNYLFITGIDLNKSNLVNRTADANVIFMDGSMETVKINMAKSTLSTTNNEMDANLNTWCTYTVNNSDVYTVKEVSDVAAGGRVPGDYDTNGDGKDDLTVKVAQFNWAGNGEITIDSRHISLQGSYNAGAYNKVYGTDDTVYLTVGLDELTNNSKTFGIINDVASVATGIDNVSLTAWSALDVANKADDHDTSAKPGDHGGTVACGVYSLYDDNGDIIATVVVGEDAGTSKNLVYAHTSATSSERYNRETGLWTWSREVISDGQEITLTEVGDGLSELGSMDQYTWYQVRYNADGNVVEVSPAASELTPGKDYITDYDDIAAAVADNDNVLYTSLAPKINSENLTMTGRTLWVDTTASKGFRVASDVNVALIQTNNRTEKTYFETGSSALESIVDDLNERHYNVGGVNTEHGYVISAIIEDGIATSVVIYDASTICDPYEDPDWGTPSRDIASVAFTADGSFRLVDARGNNITSGTFKYELQESGVGGYKVVQSGTVNAATDTFPATTGFFGSALQPATSYRLVVDGVVSDVIAK